MTISRREENRLNLLDEGVRLMMAQGYHGTGVKKLVDTVGIPKGSFYQYFESKEHFCASTVEYYIDPYIARLNAYLEQKPEDALGAIRAYFLEQTAKAASENYQGGCLLGNLLGEVSETHATCYQALQSAVGRYCEVLESAFLRAQNEGTVTCQMEAKEMANILFCAWQGALLRMKVERSTWPMEACLTSLLDYSFCKLPDPSST